ncbi:MAG: tRNA pseudouridine(38-40) synthase TruA [Chitinophagaceae bacterium]|nr:tRNA pseudouridine(38-40) synthase TruA [Chitinophagaceae bacterium]
MPRYFIEVSYMGTGYSGFQVQKNANSVQAEVEKALLIFYKKIFELTGSSRTDAGVHALQNFFHFDTDSEINDDSYNLNAILPADIVIKKIFRVDDDAHCRFDAGSREYRYYIFSEKNPFLQDRAYYYPFPVNLDLVQKAAAEVLKHQDFTSFSKRNTQVKSFLCNIHESEWIVKKDCLVYKIKANRFLRGMVKGLVGTMLQVGREKITVEEFGDIFQSKDCTKADFSVPSEGLFLCKVEF